MPSLICFHNQQSSTLLPLVNFRPAALLPETTVGGVKRRSMEDLVHDEIKLGVIDHNIKDVLCVLKGKRTKRQRHQSPIPFPMITATADHSSSSHHPLPSPATSSEFPAGSSAATSTTDEDEDTAMCLILLSKGFSSKEKHPKIEKGEFSVYKFNSKKYLQPPTATTVANSKAGIFIYECKTCGRTFPSFQALGGHRTSHKRPKTTVDLKEKKKPLMAFSDQESLPPPPPPTALPESSIKRISSSSSSSLSLQLSTRPLFLNPNNKSPKIHECSICGAEFISGQALGGHMRRHRLPSTTVTTTASTAAASTKLSLLPNSPIETETEDEKMSRNDGFSLDLNLPPAPEDHDHDHLQHDSKFAFKSKQEQQLSSFVMSTRPNLVDCHY